MPYSDDRKAKLLGRNALDWLGVGKPALVG
jgi:hypothetical protein